MPATELLTLATQSQIDELEAKCMEYLGQGRIRLAEAAAALEKLGKDIAPDRIAALGRTILENCDPASDPVAAARLSRVVLLSNPDDADARKAVVDSYRRAYGHMEGFDTILEHAGFNTGRPARNALRIMDICMTVKVGDALVSRTEDLVVEVSHVDHVAGLYTVKSGRNPTTLPTVELARRYDPADPDDFRVLRELRPQKLQEMIETDPVAVIIGLIRAQHHGHDIDVDTLKSELVPHHLPDSAWTKWWTRARTAVKKAPNLTMEGRAPVVLRLVAKARTVEEDVWDNLTRANEPSDWLSTISSYLRGKKADKEPPDAGLIDRIRTRLLEHAATFGKKRPSEALGALLVARLMDEQLGAPSGEPAERAAAMLTAVHDPTELITGLEDTDLWDAAITALLECRPQDAAARMAELMPAAPAALLDRVALIAIENGLVGAVQGHVDTAAADPLDYPEIIYWLWKGPKSLTGVTFPPDDALLAAILLTLSALGRTLIPRREIIAKTFRQRVKAALSLRDFARVRACFANLDAGRAVTVRGQLSRLDGLGDNVPQKLNDLLREVHPTLWKAPDRRVEDWADAQVLYATRRGIERKTEERDTLVNVTMRDNARRIGEAAALGDLSENSEYKFALEERDLLRARLAQMNNELSIARPIEPFEIITERIGIGTRVVLRDAADGSTRQMTFLGPFDGDLDQGIFNYKAPVAQRLMGLRAGEQVRLSIDGRESDYEVVSIVNGLTTLE